jgi:hypothetical protein
MPTATHPPRQEQSHPAVSQVSREHRDGLDRLREIYVFTEGHPIEEFLASSPKVVAKLLEARPHVDEIWGKNASVVLDLFLEYDDLLENHMFAYVETSEPFANGMASLNRFDQEYWNKSDRDVFPHLIFDIRFV